MSTALLIAIIVLLVAVLGLAFLVLGALRALGLVNWRLDQLEMTRPSRLGRDGLKPGKKAPDFTLSSVDGDEVSLRDFAGRKLLLVFTQSGCGPCHEIAPELNRLHDKGEHQVLVVNNGDPESTREWAAETKARFPVLAQEKFSVSKRYEAFATPFAFLIDEQGIVRSKGIVGSRQYLGYVLSGVGQHRKHDDAESDGDEPQRGEHERDNPDSGRFDKSRASREVIHA
jgi:methylamine dehydrogenase accessory protein MauD